MSPYDNRQHKYNVVTSWDNFRRTVDLSIRTSWFKETDDFGAENFIGVDLYNVFSSSQGDWGTMTLQFYLTRIDNHPNPPPYFESGNDWELVPRIANFNYTGLYGHRVNFRVGHFEIPYGLEVPINSNGTLRQLLTANDLGVKLDWGVGLNGILVTHRLEYEVTLSRGSGIEYSDRGDPFIVAGRLGTPIDERFVFGLSGFHGEVQRRSGTMRRTRLGVDVQCAPGPIALLAQLSLGRDEEREIVNGFVEFNTSIRDGTLMAYGQGRVFTEQLVDNWEDAMTLTYGCRFAPNASWALSGQFEQVLSAYPNHIEDNMVNLQARYRF